MFYPIWGHVITDNIRRLWFLKSETFNSQFKNCPLVYVPHVSMLNRKNVNFKRLLEILEIDVDKLKPVTQPTRFDKIILPDGSFAGSFTSEYRETIERVRNFALKNRTPTSSKKIYYFYGRHQFGEERLAEYFKSKGYEIISPERLTTDEQLNLLINAESFASTIGSCSHNSIFLREGTETIFIRRFASSYSIYQRRLDQVNSCNATYIDSSLSVFNMRHDLFCFILSEQLKRFFGDKFDGYEAEDFKTFLEYTKFAIKKGRSINPKQKEAYGVIFTDFTAQLKQHEDLIAAYGITAHGEEFRPTLTYQTHVHKKGWSSWINETQLSNPLDQKLDIQAIKINFPSHKVYYSVNDKEGWSEEVSNGEQAGTTGKSKAIYGIRIRLDEAGQKEFDILYRVHKFDGAWTDWAKNGAEILSQGVKLNVIQIKLETKRT